MIYTLILLSVLVSTLWYVYLHKKTRISLKYLYIDNVIVVAFSSIFFVVVSKYIYTGSFIYALPIFPVLGFSFLLTMYRFWRTPSRKVLANGDDLASPADGNIIYIKSIDAGEVPISIKNGLEAKISEITETDLLNQGGWLIGINMTPFDVHKNCAPITGRIILNKHINGEFLSLKEPTALVRNERNTLVIETETGKYFGIVQTASKLVKRIDSYVKVGQEIERGDWFGMIRFGSQVDLIIPNSYTINVSLGQQVYAKTTTIASHADTI